MIKYVYLSESNTSQSINVFIHMLVYIGTGNAMLPCCYVWMIFWPWACWESIRTSINVAQSVSFAFSKASFMQDSLNYSAEKRNHTNS